MRLCESNRPLRLLMARLRVCNQENAEQLIIATSVLDIRMASKILFSKVEIDRDCTDGDLKSTRCY